MAETNAKQPAAAAGCQIVRVVMRGQAAIIVGRFKEGESTRQLARIYGMSRAGVEELIRHYGWQRRSRKR